MKEININDLVYEGKYNIVKQLLVENPNLAQHTDESRRLPIHWACSGGHDNIVELLLQYDFPLDSKDDDGWTPLIIASSAGKKNIVNMLLCKGANVNESTNSGRTAILYAASKNHVEILKILLDYNADSSIADNMHGTPLHRAASLGHTDIINILLESEGNRNNIDAKDKSGNTALHLACEEGREIAAKLLVQKGASLSILNKESKTPLDLAQPALSRSLLSLASSF